MKVKLGVAVVDDKRMRELNRQYRGQDQTTDVLAFPQREELPSGVYSLGEVVINKDQARESAKKYGVSEKEEMVRLLVHGALHILGFRDDTSAKKEKMEQLQERVVKKVMK